MSFPNPDPANESSAEAHLRDDGLSIECEDKALDTAVVSEDIGKLLGAMWADGRGPRPGLIFPVTRSPQTPGQHAIRVSEQESRVLITEWLENHGFHYSIETPTIETYQQSGSRKLSARTDITVYRSFDPDPSQRVLNIELKAGLPTWEAFRKDFEKLLREGVPGLWFHTLAKADAKVWTAIENKIRLSLSEIPTEDPDSSTRDRKDLGEVIESATNSVHFVFFVLETGSIEQSFNIDFNLDWYDQLKKGFHLQPLGSTSA